MFFSESINFKMAKDISGLRETKDYQTIRHEINRRFNPLAGGTNWEQVRQACERLCASVGADFFVAIYYTVAAMKTQGLVGLANGLELQVAVLTQQLPNLDDKLTSARRDELYHWMIGRIGTDIRLLQPERDQLRDLYRCERAAQWLYDRLNQQHSQQASAFESLGFIIFEHIDRLEVQGVPVHAPVQASSEESVKKHRFLTGFLCLIVGIAIGVGVFQFKERLPSVLNSLTKPQRIFHAQPLLSQPVLQRSFSQRQLAYSYTPLLQLAQQQVENTLSRPIGQGVLDMVDVTDSLLYLYPYDSQLLNLKADIDAWQEEREDYLQTQYSRFLFARTAMANLRLAVDRKEWDNVSRLAKNIEQYAISLSPVYGRTFYIQDLLSKGDYSQAERELAVLEVALQSLALKAAKMREQLLFQPSDTP